jgi:hypothetical protein
VGTNEKNQFAGAFAALAFAALAALGVSAACGGNAGSTLTSCPSPDDVTPGASCAEGFACTSSSSLPDCPGSRGSLVCACIGAIWVCSDPSENPCFSGASEDAGGGAADDAASVADGGAGDVEADAGGDSSGDSSGENMGDS